MDPLVATLPWAAPFLTFPWLARRRPRLADAGPMSGRPVSGCPVSGRLVSVIIPARNESITIAAVIRSVLATAYQPIELLVVDDRSTDDTAAQVEHFAAADPRVRLIRGAELPAGWYGKPWACHQGYRAARGDILVFTDADTCHEPGLLGHAVGALVEQQVGLVSVLPFQRCVTFWERLVMPQVWYLLGLRYQPQRVNRATRPRDVIANGQFILVTREAYEAAGTHEAARAKVAEDLALAQAFFRAGRKVHLAHAEELMETRMYRSLPHLIEGWSKNAYLGGRQSFPDEPLLRALVPPLLVLAAVFWLLPLAALAGGAALGDVAVIRSALIAMGLSALFWAVISHRMSIPAWYGLLYPLGGLVTLYIFLRSLWRGGRRVEWRGRTYGTPRSGAVVTCA